MSGDRTTADAVAALKGLAPDGTVERADLPFAEVLQAPQEQLGPFSALPSTLQSFLRSFHRDEEEIRTLARGRLSLALIRSGAILSRVLYGAENEVARARDGIGRSWQRPLEQLRQRLRHTARKSTHLPFVARRRLHTANAQLRILAGKRDLASILRSQHFDVRRLAYSYIEGLQQVPGCVAVQKRQRPSVTNAVLMGLDFVQSGGRCWFLEANCSPVLMDVRMTLHLPGADPWVNNMLRSVLKRGYRRLVIYGYRPFRPGHGRALIEAGRQLGVELIIFDDIFSRRFPGHERAWLMDTSFSDAFVLRCKTFDVLFDRAILSKQETRGIVESAAIDWQSAGIGVPPLLKPGDPAPQYSVDSRFPNIVGKRDDLDRGMGISFYKLPNVPTMTDQVVDYFEEYRIPDPCTHRLVRGEQLPLPGNGPKAWKIRSYAMLTPEGIEYLSSIKVISGVPVPEQLADGLVAHKNIYLSTINEGGVYSAVTSAEDEVYQRAVGAVGGALLDWLKNKHPADFSESVRG